MTRVVGSSLMAGAILAAAAFACGTGAGATDWPSKPVRVIVPFAAGGASDTVGRIFAAALGSKLGQPFVTENRGGGGSIPGTEAAAHAAPDGYTFMVSGISSHVIAPAMQHVGFDPMRDFTHVAYFGGTPVVIAVHPASGIKSVQDLVAWAGRHNKVEYVSPGFGSVAHMVGEYFASRSGLRLQNIPYRGGGSAIFDLVAGHVPVGFLSWSTAVEHVRTGRLAALAVTTTKRLPDFPDIPTFEELGYDGFVLTSWQGLSAPARLPKDIAGQVNAAVNASMTLPEVRAGLDKQSILTQPMTPEEYSRFVDGEIGKWAPVVKGLQGR
jgi:tripartite-type tricarboxylate transporter receptor subunit TctC